MNRGACTCQHARSEHLRGGFGRCGRANCACLFGPPPVRRMAVPKDHPTGIATVDEHGVVERFERDLTDVAPPIQTMTIADWHPSTSANRSHDHWRKIRQAHHADQTMAWAAAQQAGWRYVVGKVSLTIVLIYPRTYRVDADNLAAKCKGLIDGLKLHRDRGFFRDDSTEWLDLHVSAEVRKGVKATVVTLAGAEQTASQTEDQQRLWR